MANGDDGAVGAASGSKERVDMAERIALGVAASWPVEHWGRGALVATFAYLQCLDRDRPDIAEDLRAESARNFGLAVVAKLKSFVTVGGNVGRA